MVINVYSQYFAAGQISYKAAVMGTLQTEIDALAAANSATVFWSSPLNEARLG